MTRSSIDAWALSLAVVTAKRGTCLRRQVGCVLLDARRRVLATGHNGVARGLPHCNEAIFGEEVPTSGPYGVRPVLHPHACAGAKLKSGMGLDTCEAVHAEVNACLQCGDVMAIESCYVTVSPCVSCTKLLMNTGCRRIVFRTPYIQDETSRALWEKLPGRTWEHFVEEPTP